jgi:hypothetical protein
MMEELFFEYGYIAYFIASGLVLNLLSPLILISIFIYRFGLHDMFKAVNSIELKNSNITSKIRYLVPFYVVYAHISFLLLSLKCKNADEVVKLRSFR